MAWPSFPFLHRPLILSPDFLSWDSHALFSIMHLRLGVSVQQLLCLYHNMQIKLCVAKKFTATKLVYEDCQQWNNSSQSIWHSKNEPPPQCIWADLQHQTVSALNIQITAINCFTNQYIFNWIFHGYCFIQNETPEPTPYKDSILFFDVLWTKMTPKVSQIIFHAILTLSSTSLTKLRPYLFVQWGFNLQM